MRAPEGAAAPLAITALARRFGLARSTLLHYDHLGLLTPSGRSGAGYRRYGPEAERRLEAICAYRRAGLSLKAIARILEGAPGQVTQALAMRLAELDEGMAALREQQRVLAGLLQGAGLPAGPLDKGAWVALLGASGLSPEAMDRWHVAFERLCPLGHQRFLELLGLAASEIRDLRQRCAASQAKSLSKPV